MNEKPNPKKIGELTEQIIITELLKLDYIVSKPVGDNQRYDLIIESKRDGSLKKIQCKTGKYSNGVIISHLYSVRINKTGYFIQNYKNQVDYIIIYCYYNNISYIINPLEFGQSAYLRVEETKINSKVEHWARDYELQENNE